MKKALLALAIAGAGLGFAPAANAIRPCEPLEIDCHKQCTLPQDIKTLTWAQC